MAKYSRIEWTDATWSPVTGCAPISEGCQNCYAKRMSKRIAGRCGYPADEPFRVTLHPERLEEPLKWKKPRRVFVCSMGDLFHEQVPDEYITKVWEIMNNASHHTFLVLTKRPQRMKDFLARLGWYIHDRDGYPMEAVLDEGGKYTLKNVWLGVTAENQQRTDERIPILLQIPAAVRFVSVEPMLGPVDLTNIKFDRWTTSNVLEGCGVKTGPGYVGQSIPNFHCEKIDWVICGGETGPGARPIHPDWVRSLRDQCQDSGVPFFFKQWGTWKPVEQVEHGLLPDDEHRSRSHMVIDLKGEDWTGAGGYKFAQPGWHFERTGKKKKAGRLLDGEIWDEMPEI